MSVRPVYPRLLKIARHALIPLYWFALLTMNVSVCAEVAVIVNPYHADLKISKHVLKQLYLGKRKKLADGTLLVPLNREPGSKARTVFNATVLNKTESQVRAYWVKRLFTGKGTPPKSLDGDSAVKHEISMRHHLIGYIDKRSVDNSVKVIMILPSTDK